MSAQKIRVFIVDDSVIVRRLASEALRTDPDIEVVGTAPDPYLAQKQISTLKPDVLTLDLEMPKMDGLTFLRLIMERHPMPVVVMSSLTQHGSDFALEALRLGAIDILAKPSGPYSFGDLSRQLVEKVRIAAGARARRSPPAAAPAPPAKAAAPRPGGRTPDPREVILLGASTGGTEALSEVLTHLPADLPGIAIVQHIPPTFSRAFAERLNRTCAMEVREAVQGDVVRAGLALIAPGDRHLLLRWNGRHYTVDTADGPQVWHQRPAVDLLFKSAADCGAGPHAIAGVLTGMGRDGAAGLLTLRGAGATTFAQDEASSVVYGMPKEAWTNGAAQLQLPLDRVADFVIARGRNRPRHGAAAARVCVP